MHDELRDFLNSKSLVDPSSKAFTYGDGPSGSKHLRDILATFFNEYFQPVQDVNPSQLMITNGVTSAIEHVAWAIADPGDGILLGRPYYRAFLPDISLRTGVKVVPVAFGDMDPLAEEGVAKYEQALLASNKAGVKIRALMLCHPHNPLGRCYSKETIIALMRMCQKHSIHLISDEIYALSVWKNNIDKLDVEPTPFESVLSIDTAGIIDPGLVHVLWGMSKDFGANGIRLGVIISQSNDESLGACRTCALYSAPSSLTENATHAIMNDKSFLQSYIKGNQERLSEAYSHAVGLLQKYNISHKTGVNAAFFLWVDLGKSYLQRHPEEQPKDITNLLFDKLMAKKIFIVNGEVAGTELPGWFRIVFTQPRNTVEEGTKRIADALQ
jgi:aspartate/methionine/tyrosine aminotransferase